MTSLRTLVGENVRRLRIQRGLTQAQLAEALGKSTDMVSRIERGDAAPSFETLEALCAVLQTSAAVFFGEGDEWPSSTRAADTYIPGLSDAPDESTWLQELLEVIRRKPS
jgi:transcriptional regulator with XRE-family HTH domain